MNDKFERVTITRQQAARQEIDTAIELLLDGGSPVAIEVLTWAAVEMMRGIAKHQGVETFQAKMEASVRPEYLKEWREILKGHYNYFKHGDRDPERVASEFMPEGITYPLFGACCDYQAIFGKLTLAMLVYIGWFFARHPGVLKQDKKDLSASLAGHINHPQNKPYGQSLEEVSEIYKLARQHPEIFVRGLGNEGKIGFEF